MPPHIIIARRASRTPSDRAANPATISNAAMRTLVAIPVAVSVATDATIVRSTSRSATPLIAAATTMRPTADRTTPASAPMPIVRQHGRQRIAAVRQRLNGERDETEDQQQIDIKRQPYGDAGDIEQRLADCETIAAGDAVGIGRNRMPREDIAARRQRCREMRD
jgi:hypothetical protein